MKPAAPDAPPVPDEDLAAELAIAHLAAARAAAFIARHWGQDPEVHYKGAINPVSEADLGAERIITALLADRFPDDRVIAEEGGGHAGTTGRTWYVDPLDGTTNFSHGMPHFCVSIASADARGPRVAVIAEPLRRWFFSATRGGGAWLDGRRLAVSAVTRMERALLATGFPYDRHTAHDNNSHRFAAALRRAQGVRRAGSAALDLAYVAAGWFDGFWEDRLSPWDLAAGVLLVREAGGAVTDFAGEALAITADGAGRVVASNGQIHQAIVALIAESDAAFAAGGTT
ncbi:MAG: inositol monophosphatase [Myxococcales bacterium]|nr:inositol monophosphatase [Myxococcales bacterium]MCB9550524.1 inositol monophosphatase [Myxococcales bacterium]